MAKLSLTAVTDLLKSPSFVDGLEILYGSLSAAGKKLGISAKRLRAIDERFYDPTDKAILDVQRGLAKLPKGEVDALKAYAQIGDKFSPWQVRVFKKKSKTERGYRDHFSGEVKRQAGRFAIDWRALAGSPRSKGTRRK